MKQFYFTLSAGSESKGLRFLFILILIFQSFQPASAQWSSDPSVNTRINGGTSTPGFEKHVVRSGNGFFVTWDDYRKGGEHPELYMQYLNAKGERQWANNGKAICANSGGQSSALMTPDGSGGVIVAWVDYRPELNPADPWATDIYAQRISANGELLWNEDGYLYVRLRRANMYLMYFQMEKVAHL